MSIAPKKKLISLSVQIIGLQVFLILLTALAIGVPAIWLVRSQLEQSTWEQVSQDSRMAQALWATYQSELNNLALVTSQRPTLVALVESGQQAEMVSYLETLRQGARLDLVLLCDLDGQPTAQVGRPAPPHACAAGPQADAWFEADDAGPGWLLSSQDLANGAARVVVGWVLDEAFLGRMHEQTGGEYSLFYQDWPVVSSFTGAGVEPKVISAAVPTLTDSSSRGMFSLAGATYYAVRSRDDQTGMEIVAARPASEIVTAQRRLTWEMSIGILFVALVSSALGGLMASRITRPLARLRDSAFALRRGDLQKPIITYTRVREIAQVAYALEDARIALQHSWSEQRREKAWTDQLLNSIVEGILTTDRLGRITFFSPGAGRIAGCEPEQALGKTLDQVFQPAQTGERFSQRLPQPGKMQEIVTVQVKGRPVTLAITSAEMAPPEAGKASLALVLRDISNDEAMRRLLGDFLATITHEFRTPLTAQAVAIELLLDQLDDLNRDELRELLNAQHLGVLSLQLLIDNLLEGASIEAGRFHVAPQPAELAEIVAEAQKTMQPLLAKYGLTLRVDLPADLPVVMADARRTGQVLVNLLSNAIKWSPRGAEITIGAGVDSGAAEQQVRVAVSDCGPGILADELDGLFSRFSDLEPNRRTRAEHGAGLGLSVVKAIVEAQGGQVGVENQVAGGAAFWFTLPVMPPESDELAAQVDLA